MKLYELNEKMKAYNSNAAYGSECAAWGDFVADSYDRLGMAPWDDRAEETEVPEDMAEYWIDVTNNANDDYDNNGSRIDA
jgi:hypothetical protein